MQDLAESFHPLLWSWFKERFAEPTPAQAAAWPLIRQGHHTLITAPTGGGKTLSAFLVIIDQLLRQALANDIPEGIQVLYISPLRALSHDVDGLPPLNR